MKTDDALKTAFAEDHFVVWLIPGATALFPYAFVLNDYWHLEEAWGKNEIAFTLGFLLAASGAGILLESIGGWIETKFYDKGLRKKFRRHIIEWTDYLTIAFSTEPIGHRYLRHRVRLMKFETSMGLAIPIALAGCFWLFGRGVAFSYGSLGVLFLFAALLTWYCFFDAYAIADMLSKLRHRLLRAHRDQQLGVPPPPLDSNS